MSYEKALRVVDVIAARHASAQARGALAEVKAILQALEMVSKYPGAPVQPVEEIVKRADPAALPAYNTDREDGVARAKETKRARGYTNPHAWPKERREALFDFIGQGNQIMDAVRHYDLLYQTIRNQILNHGDPKDPRFAHLKRRTAA